MSVVSLFVTGRLEKFNVYEVWRIVSQNDASQTSASLCIDLGLYAGHSGTEVEC